MMSNERDEQNKRDEQEQSGEKGVETETAGAAKRRRAAIPLTLRQEGGEVRGASTGSGGDDGRETEPMDEARRTTREQTRHVLRESGIGEMLQTLNKNALQGRGWFEEYDSGVLFKWGAGYTRRHIWVDVSGEQLRFRLRQHIRCAAAAPICDGEYHSFTPEMWRQRRLVLRELNRNYEHPVAETSED